MMDLEEQLGKTLLIRGRKSVTLTEEGAYLRTRAQEPISLETLSALPLIVPSQRHTWTGFEKKRAEHRGNL